MWVFEDEFLESLDTYLTLRRVRTRPRRMRLLFFALNGSAQTLTVKVFDVERGSVAKPEQEGLHISAELIPSLFWSDREV